MNTKGNLDDLSMPIVLLSAAVSIIAAYLILSSVGTSFSSSTEANNLITAGKLMISRVGNSSFIFIAVALILFNVIGAFLLLTHPVFMIVDIILLPLSVMIAAIISNAYEASLYTLSVSSAFPVMNFIMLHLPVLIVVSSIFSGIAAYALVKQ